MAQFDAAIRVILKHEGGYQNSSKDRGNYVSATGEWVEGKYPNFKSPTGKAIYQIGTNRGITAPELYEYLGRLPTVADMKNLSEMTAKEIYKENYWKPMRGNEINSQAIANIIFDGCVNQGKGFMLRSVQTVLKIEVDGIVGPVTIAAINAANQGQLFKWIKEERRQRYLAIAKQPGQSGFLAGWLSRLNSFKEIIKENAKTITLTGVILSVGLFFLIKNSNSNERTN